MGFVIRKGSEITVQTVWINLNLIMDFFLRIATLIHHLSKTVVFMKMINVCIFSLHSYIIAIISKAYKCETDA